MEEPWRLVVDTLPALVWTARPDGYIDFLNQRWLEYTGLSAEEAIGWGWQVAVHDDDLPALVSYWRRVLASGVPGEYEARLRSVDGTYRWFLFRAVPGTDVSGAPTRWFGQTVDIEERRRAEALLAGEKRLLEMVAQGHDLQVLLRQLCLLVEATADGCHCSIVLIEPNTQRLQHVAAPTLPAAFIDAIDGRPVNAESGPCAMAAFLNEQVIVVDTTLDERWRAWQWCPLAVEHDLRACWSTPIAAASGDVLGTFALYYRQPGAPSAWHLRLIEQFRHIASIAIERAQYEGALRRGRALLAQAQRVSATGSFSWTTDTDVLRLSDEACRLLRFAPAGAPTLEMWRDRVHPDDRALFDTAVARVRLERRDLEIEHRMMWPDGTTRHVHVVAQALSGDGRVVTEYVGAIRDVTERVRAEDALHTVRSELAHIARVTTLGQLTASIAHEVNQPLLGIVTNASTCLRLLAADPPDLDLARETARRTIRDGNRAADVIARLRALFSRQATNMGHVDLNDAIADVVALFEPETRRERVSLVLELSDDLPPVHGDRVQLQQVVLNLLMNAVDALADVTDRARRIVIHTCTRENGQVAVTVEDSGKGVDEASQARLFDAFYTTKGGGMGLGLSISRTIVEGHGGHMWVEANAGPGATVGFLLPSPER